MNMQFSRFLIILFSSTLMLMSCEKENVQVIDETFVPYVDRFFEEAQMRGLDLKKEDFSFSMEFGSIAHAAGICRYATNEMTINPNHWNDRNEIGKEYLVFHELGHCILDRRHENVILDHGECKSIMKGTEDGRRCLRSLVSDIWRSYYVDELFDPETLPPDWYIDEIETEIDQEILAYEDSSAEILIAPITGLDTRKNFDIVANISKSNFRDQVELSWGNFKMTLNEDAILIAYPEQPIYYHLEWTVFQESELRFVQLGDFQYFLVDEKMFHMDQLPDNSFSSIRLSVFPTNSSPEVRLSLQVNQLK
ncbi:MAG: hypothetical protein AAF587_13980 [Bacteroidota bacterium]